MIRIFYSLLFFCLLPLVFVRLWLRGAKSPEYRRRWGERLGLSNIESTRGGLWIHAVSLGEAIAATPLINALLKDYPGQILVTCMTPTGSAHIQKTFGPQVQHVYLPYDLSFMLRPLIRQAQARSLVIMETELWPNLLHECRRAGMRNLLVNGRLSAKSAQGYRRVAWLTRWMLGNLDGIAAQYEEDAQRFIALDAPEDKIQALGNIKFDVSPPPSLVEQGNELRRRLGVDRPVVVFASTHDDEEVLALDVTRQLSHGGLNVCSIIVPRHPERFADVAQQIQDSGLRFAIRSQQGSIDRGTQVYLADTMGELWVMYQAADVAVVGGSFVSRGGHNPLEPAALAKPIVCGTSHFNFLVVTEKLRENGGLQVVSRDELASVLEQLLGDKSQAVAQGRAALAVIESNQGALTAVLDLIKK